MQSRLFNQVAAAKQEFILIVQRNPDLVTKAVSECELATKYAEPCFLVCAPVTEQDIEKIKTSLSADPTKEFMLDTLQIETLYMSIGDLQKKYLACDKRLLLNETMVGVLLFDNRHSKSDTSSLKTVGADGRISIAQLKELAKEYEEQPETIKEKLNSLLLEYPEIKEKEKVELSDAMNKIIIQTRIERNFKDYYYPLDMPVDEVKRFNPELAEDYCFSLARKPSSYFNDFKWMPIPDSILESVKNEINSSSEKNHTSANLRPN